MTPKQGEREYAYKGYNGKRIVSRLGKGTAAEQQGNEGKDKKPDDNPYWHVGKGRVERMSVPYPFK